MCNGAQDGAHGTGLDALELEGQRNELVIARLDLAQVEVLDDGDAALKGHAVRKQERAVGGGRCSGCRAL